MIKDFLLGLRSYQDAHALIKKNKLWSYVLLPGLINLVLFIITIWVGWKYSKLLTDWLLDVMGVDSIAVENWGFIKTTIHIMFLIIFRLLFILFYLFIYKYVVLILMAPVLAILSERADEIISGNRYPFNFRQFIKDVIRGIILATRNLCVELLLIVLLFFFAFIPVVGLISTPLIFIVECYFYGFSMIDYSNERQKLTVRESTAFIGRHRGIAIANGAMFYLLLLVPVIGLMVAPSYGVVAAAIAADRVR
ncbi:MAG: EI24 domain-containing protein [Bacteroidota bacterium]